jgi:prophage regulatory protein
MSGETEISDCFVKLDEVKRRVGLSKTMIYRLVQEGKFPAPYKLSPFASRWSDREIVAWIDDVPDRQSRVSERIERKLDMTTELLGVFVQYHLTLVAHQPQFDAETGRLGLDRYQRLFTLAERRIAKGEGTSLIAGRAAAE